MPEHQGREFQTTIQAPTRGQLDSMLQGMRRYAKRHNLGPIHILESGADPDGGYRAIVTAHNWNPIKWVKEKLSRGRERRRARLEEEVEVGALKMEEPEEYEEIVRGREIKEEEREKAGLERTLARTELKRGIRVAKAPLPEELRRPSRLAKAEKAVKGVRKVGKAFLPAQPTTARGRARGVPQTGLYDFSGLRQLTAPSRVPRTMMGAPSTGAGAYSLKRGGGLLMPPGFGIQEQQVPVVEMGNGKNQDVVLQLVQEGYTDVDSMVAASGLKAAQVNRALKALAQKGLIRMGGS